MSRLFVELYLDEDVDVLVAELLRSYGFSAITTREVDQLHYNDQEQLTYAINQKRAIVTHNRGHFEKLTQEYYASETTHYGIIIAVRRPPHEIMRRLLKILDSVTADEMKNQIRYI